MIVLTVPHSTCPSVIRNHECDFAAVNAAQTLSSVLQLTHTLFIGNMDRTQCDLNRDECLNQPYRQQLSEYLRTHQISLLLDIHSFPSWSEFGHYNFYLLLNYTPNNYTGIALSPKLIQRVKEAGYSCALIWGENNSIVMEALSMGIPAILLEFNEDLSTYQLRSLCQLVSDWILDLTKESCYLVLVHSPVQAKIAQISQDEVQFYLSPHDNHLIRAPVDGLITHINIVYGEWQREVFNSFEKKHIRVEISIQLQSKAVIRLWIEADTPDYITSTIRLLVQEGTLIQKGTKIAEILIGSLVGLSFQGLDGVLMVERKQRVMPKTVVGVFCSN